MELLYYIEKESKKKICLEDHPFVKNGVCRFCLGYQKKTLNELIKNKSLLD